MKLNVEEENNGFTATFIFLSCLKYKNIHLWAAAESTEASVEELFELGKGKTAKSLAGDGEVEKRPYFTRN